MPLPGTEVSLVINSSIRSTPSESRRLELVGIIAWWIYFGSFVFWPPVWLACTLSFILGLPSLGSSVAFSAATSIATIGLYISYGAHYIFFWFMNVHILCVIDRHPNCTSRDLPRSICPRAIPSWGFLLPCRPCRCDVDLLYHYRVHFTWGQRKLAIEPTRSESSDVKNHLPAG
jgi:hypothetical protein